MILNSNLKHYLWFTHTHDFQYTTNITLLVSSILGIKSRTGQVLYAYHLEISQSKALGNLNNSRNTKYFRQLILCDNCDENVSEVHLFPNNFSRNFLKNLPNKLNISFKNINLVQVTASANCVAHHSPGLYCLWHILGAH